jgi:hypothetical protein
MFSATAFRVRPARSQDEPALRRLAFLDSADPLTGRILLGEVDGVPAAAISLEENRIVADPFQKSDALRVHLRMRAAGIVAHERMPSVRDRIRAAMRRERIAGLIRA